MHLFTVKNFNKKHDKVHKNYANKLERHIAGNFLFFWIKHECHDNHS